MAVGDQSDMLIRLQRLLPTGWFGDSNPIRDALLWGCAQAQAWCYTLYLYAKAQTRIKTATDSWLDLIALDFFGDSLTRRASQGDSSYRSMILVNLFRERTTRHAIEQVLLDLTGRAPVIIEPARPADVGAYGAAVAVSRASTATYFDLAGVLRYAAPNVARYDTDPSTLASKGLLIEADATNLVTYSYNLAAASWGKSLLGVTPAAGLAPDGTMSASLLIPTTTSGNHQTSLSIGAVVAGAQYVFSFYAKAGGYSQVRLRTADNLGILLDAVIDLTTGARIAGSSTVVVTPAAGGYYRISLLVTMGATSATASIGAWVYSGGTATFAGDGVSGLFVWGAQAELANVAGSPSSYIPTNGAAAIRYADVLLTNMPTNSAALGGYKVAGAYGSLSLAYQAFVTAYRPTGQGLPYIAGYRTSTGAYSTPSRSDYAQYTADGVSDADIYAAIAATKAEGTAVWARISN